MSLGRTIGSLFEEEPAQWGLRGDPHLWREMRERLEVVPVPDSIEEFVAVVKKEFRVLAGHCMSETENFHIARYNHGGMSGGGISPEFWRVGALPLLREQYSKNITESTPINQKR